MNAEIVRGGITVGHATDVSLDDEYVHFTTDASLTLSAYDVVVEGGAPLNILVVVLAQGGHDGPARLRATALRALACAPSRPRSRTDHDGPRAP